MATSPIYSWPEPDNTDLVKNGALAIRTLGNAIDTTMGTMVAKTVVDAKGDLIAGTAADTVNRLAVGNNGQTLVADSSTSTGLAYSANAPLAGLSLIAAGVGLTGASTITVSGISNKSRLMILVYLASSANAGSYMGIRFNGDSTAGNYIYSGTTIKNNVAASASNLSADQMFIAQQGTSAADTVNTIMHITGAFGAGLVTTSQGTQASGVNADNFSWIGSYNASAQITSISIVSSTGNFDNGSMTIWGA